MIKDDLGMARTALEAAALGFDPRACSGQDAIDLLTELGVQRRLIDGLVAKVEGSLLRAAARGIVPLRDACVAARARREDEAARATRQHAARSFHMWTAPDGMFEGHFKVTPEVGGRIKACIEDRTRRRFRSPGPTGLVSRRIAMRLTRSPTR